MHTEALAITYQFARLSLDADRARPTSPQMSSACVAVHRVTNPEVSTLDAGRTAHLRPHAAAVAPPSAPAGGVKRPAEAEDGLVSLWAVRRRKNTTPQSGGPVEPTPRAPSTAVTKRPAPAVRPSVRPAAEAQPAPRPLRCNQLEPSQRRQLARVARDLAGASSRSEAHALLEEAAAALDPLHQPPSPRRPVSFGRRPQASDGAAAQGPDAATPSADLFGARRSRLKHRSAP